MFKKYFFGFRQFPRKGRSLAAVTNSYVLTNIVRGNVFCRIGGVIYEADHKSLVDRAKEIDLSKIN